MHYDWQLANVLDEWVAGLGGDAAHVVVVTSHVDVAVHSPTLAPAVEERNSHITTWT